MGSSDSSYDRQHGGIAKRDGEDDQSLASRPLPDTAQRTLNEIAEALNITTAILGRGATAPEARWDGQVSLSEASALLKAFIQISDPEVRQRCLAFVQASAAGGGTGADRN
jgi:hypothetical protein